MILAIRAVEHRDAVAAGNGRSPPNHAGSRRSSLAWRLLCDAAVRLLWVLLLAALAVGDADARRTPPAVRRQAARTRELVHRGRRFHDIAQGKVAPPDYRDYLADLIEERYGSRYRFCKETGVDPGHLSRVLASRSELSVQNLQRILEALHAALVIQPEEDLAERVSPERGARALAAAAGP